MGFFKDMKDLKKLGDHHGGMPSWKQAMGDVRAVADDRGEGEILEKGIAAKAICKGFPMPVPNDKFATPRSCRQTDTCAGGGNRGGGGKKN